MYFQGDIRMRTLLEIRREMEKLSLEKDPLRVHTRANELLIAAMYAAVNEKITTSRKRIHVAAIDRAYNDVGGR